MIEEIKNTQAELIRSTRETSSGMIPRGLVIQRHYQLDP